MRGQKSSNASFAVGSFEGDHGFHLAQRSQPVRLMGFVSHADNVACMFQDLSA